jgi:hypothetical protein
MIGKKNKNDRHVQEEISFGFACLVLLASFCCELF